MKNGLIIDAFGNKRRYKEGKLHCMDGPACEYVNGDKVWYKEGKYHRLDGPAIEFFNGDKEYYISINENISLVYIPNKEAYISISKKINTINSLYFCTEKIIFECNSTEEFFEFHNKNLYNLYLTF